MNTNKISGIVGEKSLTIIINGVPKIVAQGATNFLRIRRAILAGDFAAIPELLENDIGKVAASFTSGNVTVINGALHYKGVPLAGVVSNKLLSILSEGISSASPFLKFLERLMSNPSSSSVLELYDFLSYKELAIDEDGFVIAYRGVGPDLWSVSGNKSTVVLRGKVNSGGQIYNGIGETIEVQRMSVDDNRRRGCSRGLHVGSFDYANSWGSRTLIVRFDPADAVSVPVDCQFQKLRVCKYQILAEIPRQTAKPITRAAIHSDSIRKSASGRLSRAVLQAEIAAIVARESLDVRMEDDVRQIRPLLSTENFNERDFLAVVAELQAAAVAKAAADKGSLRAKATRYVRNCHARGITPTLKMVQSALKVKGLTLGDICEFFKNGAYKTFGSNGYTDALVVTRN